MEGDLLQSRLLPGEHFLWRGKPAGGLLVTGRDVLLIPFALMWCAGIAFWASSALDNGAPLMLVIMGGGFAGGIGLFMAFGRFFMDAWLRGRTSYAVTDGRALILRPAPFSRFDSVDLEGLADVHIVNETASGGTIRLGAPVFMVGNRKVQSWMPSLDPTPQFLSIAEPQKLLGLIVAASRDKGTAKA